MAQLSEVREGDPRVTQLLARMDAWEQLLTGVAGRLDDAAAGVSQLRGRVDRLGEQPAVVQQLDAAPSVDQDALLQEVDRRFSALQRALSPVLDGLAERVGRLEQAPAPEAPDAAALRRELAAIDAGVAELRRILGEHGSRLDRRASDVQTLATALRKLAAHTGYRGNLSEAPPAPPKAN